MSSSQEPRFERPPRSRILQVGSALLKPQVAMSVGSNFSPRTVPLESCPVCGLQERDPFFIGTDRLHGVPGSFRYCKCRNCKSVLQDPRVVAEDLGSLYTQDYYTKTPPNPDAAATSAEPAVPGRRLRWAGEARDRIRAAVRQSIAPDPGAPRASWLGRLLAGSRRVRERAFNDHVMDEMLPWKSPPGQALDLGCGSGRLMENLARVGWGVQGVEWDPEAARIARESTGITVHVGEVEHLSLEAGQFDLIVLTHVLEHLSNPARTLRALRRLLTSDGRIVVVYPNPRSLLARRFGPDWFGWEVPRHLALLPLGALRAVGKISGFRVQRARTTARWAASLSWQSRALRDGTYEERIKPSVVDRAWGVLEAILVLASGRCGEEVVAVLAPSGAWDGS